MDSRPFRAPRSTPRDESPRGRTVSSRPDLVSSPEPDLEAPVAEQTPPTEAPGRVTAKKSSWKKWLVVLIVAIIVIAAAWYVWQRSQSSYTGIDTSKYQAVFTADGQVYFGKLHSEGNGYLKLTSAYYLETKQSAADVNTDSSSSLQLTQLHSKIYGPGDEVVFQKDQLLYFENLRDDGQVAKLIQKDAGSN